jgi:hypothetical protein
MNPDFDDLKNRWKHAKDSIPQEDLPVAEIINLSRQRKKNSLYFQYGNIVALLLLVAMLFFFFYVFFPFGELLSKSGVALMIGSLAIRIIIEAFSTLKSREINITDDALQNTNDAMNYLHFRKKIHGPVTYITVGLYTVGFYMLTPEFSKHFDLFWMILIDLSYLPAILIPFWFIKKGIKKEMEDLEELVKLQKQMVFNIEDF